MATETARCARHGEPTRLRCASCDCAICPGCMVRTDVGLRCGSCDRPAMARGARRSRRALAASAGGVTLVVLAAVAILNRTAGDGTDDSAPPRAEVVGSWSAEPALAAIRGSAIAVALPGGDVLVSGGGVGAIASTATELFDATTGARRAVGPMLEARRGHQAVVLDDGMVLVAGGVAAGRPLASAEVYDPERETWASTGAMGAPRLGHSLTLLADGRVLAAGGTSLDDDGAGAAAAAAAAGQSVTPVATTEVYDPTLRRWAPGADMTVPRFEHTATALADGRVLMVGGLGPAASAGATAPVASTELYDPVAGVFVRSAPLREARSNHAAAVLADRNIVVVGGLGGPQADIALGSAEVFDPTRGAWQRIAPLASGRSGATATTLTGGAVLVVGGEDVERGVRRSRPDAELLDPSRRAWTDAGRMACPRSEHAAVRLADGSVLVVAGDGAFPGRPPVAQSCVDRYRPAAAAAAGRSG